MVQLGKALEQEVEAGRRVGRRRVTSTHALDLGTNNLPTKMLEDSVKSGRSVANKRATGRGSLSLNALPNAGLLYEVDCPAGCGATLRDEKQKMDHLRRAHPWYLAGRDWRRG